jgi:hypothetical protein
MDRVQVARFERPLARLAPFFEARRLAPEAIEATIDDIARKDARGALFALEGLLRIYDGIQGDPFAELLAEVKSAEDAVGHFTERVEWLELGKQAGAREPVIQALERAAADARARFRELLPRVPAILERVGAVVRATAWDDEESDARAVVRRIARELRKHSRLDYDVNDLRNGIHEMRRNLRWFLIYVQALDGLVQLEPARGPLRANCYSYLESHPIAQSKFSKVEKNPRLAFVASVPRAYFLALSKVIGELGEVKSLGEVEAAFAGAIEECGLAAGADASARARELASALPTFVPDFHRAAGLILRELRETRLLKRLRRHLRRSLAPVERPVEHSPASIVAAAAPPAAPALPGAVGTK